MENLSQIKTVNDQLKKAPAKAIKALHKFIYEEEGDRENRKRLREFSGFKFDAGSSEYTRKVRYVEQNLTTGELVATCNILGLHSDSDSKDEFITKICNGLMDLQLLAEDCGNEEDESDIEDEDDENSSEEDSNNAENKNSN